MAYTITQGSISPDTTRGGSHGAVSPGLPDTVISFPQTTGTASIGPSIVASGIITMSALTAASGSGSVSVSGLTATDIVMTAIDTDANASSGFFVKVDTTLDTISFRGFGVSGSTYAKCHYIVYRSI